MKVVYRVTSKKGRQPVTNDYPDLKAAEAVALSRLAAGEWVKISAVIAGGNEGEAE